MVHFTRKKVEEFYVWMKVDLQLDWYCREARLAILAHLRSPQTADTLRAYFSGNEPYEIKHTDPTQVAAYKKIINALYHAEMSIQRVLHLDMRRERWSLGIGRDAVQVLWKGANELYDVLALINEASIDVQIMTGSYLSDVLPRVSAALTGMTQYAPEAPEKGSGALLGKITQLLPSDSVKPQQGLHKLGGLLFQLPRHFQELQLIIASDSALKMTTTAAEYQAVMLAKAKTTQADFAKLSEKPPILALSNYFSILKSLTWLSSELMSTGAPLTKSAYERAVSILNDIRHEHLPKLVAELEALEDHLGLSPNQLLATLMPKINQYYIQLVQGVNGLASAAGILKTIDEKSHIWYIKLAVRLLGENPPKLDPKDKLAEEPALSCLCDAGFIEKLDHYRSIRQSAARLIAQDRSCQESAIRFFDNLSKFYSSRWVRTTMDKFSPEEKSVLLQDYKQFRFEFASLYPEHDQLIMTALTSTARDGLLRRAADTAFMHLWRVDEVQKIINTSKSFIEKLEQHQAQGIYDGELMQRSTSIRDTTLLDFASGKSELSTEVEQYLRVELELLADEPPQSSSEEAVLSFYQDLMTHYQKQYQLLHEQLQRQQRALFGFSQFTQRLKDGHLTATEKESLRKYYTLFRRHLAAYNSQLDLQIVEKLKDDYQEAFAWQSDADILKIRADLTDHFTTEVTRSIQDMNDIFKKWQETKQKLMGKLPNTLEHVAQQPNTIKQRLPLFEKIRQIELSNNIGAAQNRLTRYLQKTLDANLAARLVVENAPPYSDQNEDDDVVGVYKKIINSLHYLKIGLARIEQLSLPDESISAGVLGQLKETIGLGQRQQFLLQLAKPVLFDFIYHAAVYIRSLKSAPELRAFLEEGRSLLEPLYEIPLIRAQVEMLANHIPTRLASPHLDAVDEWTKQQAITRDVLAGTWVEPVPERRDVADEPILADNGAEEEATQRVNYFEQIAEKMYQIQDAVHRMNPKYQDDLPLSEQEINKKVQAFVEKFSHISIDPASLQRLLNSIDECYLGLNETGVDAKDILMARIRQLPKEWSTKIMTRMDNSEFHLGLQPGTLSSELEKLFNDFYFATVTSLGYASPQQEIVLLTNTGMAEIRLANAQQHLTESLVAERTAAQTLLNAFGSDRPDIKTIVTEYTILDQLEENLHQTDLDDDATASTYQRLTSCYASLWPYLSSLGYAKDAVNHIKPDAVHEMLMFVNQLQERFSTVLKSLPNDCVVGAYAELKAMAYEVRHTKEAYFNSVEKKHAFLRHYHALYPYLNRVNSHHYDWRDIFRELENPQDFCRELQRIVGDHEGLGVVAHHITQSKQQAVARCQAKVLYLTEQIKAQQSTDEQRIAAYKDKLYDQYLRANIRSLFDSQEGDNYGVFSDLLFTAIAAHFAQIKQTICDKTSMADAIEEKIGQMMEEHYINIINAPDIIRLKPICIKLKQEVESIQQLITTEQQQPPDNQNRRNKIIYLNKLRDELLLIKDAIIVPSVDAIEQQMANIHTQLQQTLPALDTLIVYDNFISTKIKTLRKNTHTADDQAQLQILEKIKADLVADTAMDTRLVNFLTAYLSSQFQLVVDQKIEATLTSRFGFYTPVLYTAVKTKLLEKKQAITATITEQLDETLITRINEAVEQILQEGSVVALANNCQELSRLRERIDNMFQQEQRVQKASSNSCRAETIRLLFSGREALSNLPAITPNDIPELIKDSRYLLDLTIPSYDVLIQVQQQLQQLETSVTKLELASDDKDKLLRHLQQMQSTLEQEDKPVSERLLDLTVQLLQQQKLLTNTPDLRAALGKQCNACSQTLTGWMVSYMVSNDSLTEADRLLCQVLANRVNDQDHLVIEYVASQKELLTVNKNHPEIILGICDDLRQTLASISSPEVQAVKRTISEFKRTANLFTIGKNAKANRIEQALVDLPLADRTHVISGAENRVQEALASHRHLGKRGDIYKKDGKIDVSRAARTFKQLKTECEHDDEPPVGRKPT